jgi:hypothetical protein
LIDEKYVAAASTSASVMALVKDALSVGGARFGTELFLAPLLKSAICCTI